LPITTLRVASKVCQRTPNVTQTELGYKPRHGGFGTVALGARYAIVGAAGDDDACPTDPYCNSGAAYIFDIPLCVTGIPAMSTWGLAGFGVSVLVIGALLLRRTTALEDFHGHE
jgi:hypothetical protein